ncbi:MAG: prepilin peptidase [Rickettsiales bacterium]
MLYEFIIVVFLGLVFGSFISCASYRLPLGVGVVRKPSYCPNCNNKLGFKDLFPLFSWLLSGGKCQYCATKISIRYPLIELSTALIFVFLYSRYGLSVEFTLLALMAVMLTIMIIVDLEHFIIPDSVHLILTPLALAYHYVNDSLSIDILWSFGTMTALALALHYGYSYLRGRIMLGFGDVKFFMVAGLWLSVAALPVFLFLVGIFGVMLGLLWRLLKKGEIFPFGPALAVALFMCIVYPNIFNIMYFMR